MHEFYSLLTLSHLALSRLALEMMSTSALMVVSVLTLGLSLTSLMNVKVLQLKMMTIMALGQTLTAAVQMSTTMLALVLNRSSLVILGLPKTPADITTISAPTRLDNVGLVTLLVENCLARVDTGAWSLENIVSVTHRGEMSEVADMGLGTRA